MAARDRDSCYYCRSPHHTSAPTIHHPPLRSVGREDVPRQGARHVPVSFPRFRGRARCVWAWALFGHGNHIWSGPVWAAAQLHCAQRNGPRCAPDCLTPNPANTVGPPWTTAIWGDERDRADGCPQGGGSSTPRETSPRALAFDQTGPGLDNTTSAPLYRASGQGLSEEGPGTRG